MRLIAIAITLAASPSWAMCLQNGYDLPRVAEYLACQVDEQNEQIVSLQDEVEALREDVAALSDTIERLGKLTAVVASAITDTTEAHEARITALEGQK